MKFVESKNAAIDSEVKSRIARTSSRERNKSYENKNIIKRQNDKRKRNEMK